MTDTPNTTAIASAVKVIVVEIVTLLLLFALQQQFTR